jgi:hypothetical protein
MPLITSDDVRFFLMDRSASDNFLLDDLEFTDEEINNSMVLAVDKYNATPPMVDMYTSENFPFRYEMLLGASSILMKIKAINMTRNNLNYQSSDGTAINDLDKRNEYHSISQALDAEYMDRIRRIKVSRNAEQCYGYV